MSIDPGLVAEWEVDNALDADHDDPFAGDDPTDGYLEEVSERREELHRYLHAGFPCTCPPEQADANDEAPF